MDIASLAALRTSGSTISRGCLGTWTTQSVTRSVFVLLWKKATSQ